MNNIFEDQIAEVKFETGFHFKLYDLPDNKMKIISLKKDENYGLEETEDISVKKITDNIFNISWVESTELTVTQTINLSTNYIYTVMTWHDDTQYGKGCIMGHQGTYRFIKAEDIIA